jgi:4-amino-4-deoxy-L-arabinose transferase-like glycosyltransferase
LFPLLWAGVTVAVFSLSPEKKNAYILPAMPAQVLLVTLGMFGLAARLRRGARGWPGFVLGTELVLGIGIAVAGLVTLYGWGGRADMLTGAAVAVPVMIMLILAARRASGARGTSAVRRWLPPQAAGAALACVLMGSIAHAVRDNHRSAKTFARRVAEIVRAPACLDVPRLPAEASFYLPLDVRYDARAREMYDVVEPAGKKRLVMSEYRPPLPHGRVVAAESVPVPGELPEERWRLIRLTVEPDAPTSPTSRATPSSTPR